MYSQFYYDFRYDDWTYEREPLPRPVKCIGVAQAAHIIHRRLNRLLPIGHRRRGDVGIA